MGDRFTLITRRRLAGPVAAEQDRASGQATTDRTFRIM